MDCTYNTVTKTFEYTCGVYIPKKAMYALLRTTYDTQDHFDSSMRKFKGKMKRIRENDLFCSCENYNFYKNLKLEPLMKFREITKYFISLKYCVHRIASRADRSHRFFLRIVHFSLLTHSLTFNPIDILLRYGSEIGCDLVEKCLINALRSLLYLESMMSTLEDFDILHLERWASIVFSKKPRHYDLNFEKRVECVQYERKMICGQQLVDYAKYAHGNEICRCFCSVCGDPTDRLIKSIIRMCVSCRTARVLDLLYVKYINDITLFDILTQKLQNEGSSGTLF